MPMKHFVGLISLVIVAAGLTIAVATMFSIPVAALGIAALIGSLVLRWNRLRR